MASWAAVVSEVVAVRSDTSLYMKVGMASSTKKPRLSKQASLKAATQSPFFSNKD